VKWRDYPQSPDDKRVVGTVKVLEKLRSPQLGNERDILAYLPPSYATGDRRYPVIYMHDGQNLFDPTTSFGGEWEVDQTMEAASRDGLEAIVIGIPNSGEERCNEYSPFKDAKAGGGKGDDYLDFIIDTLKPIIDAEFRTLTGRLHTGIAGSSMGGLITLYAFFRNPQTFGFCGAMSPSLWFANREIFDYIELTDFIPGRIYLDCGTREGNDAMHDVRRLRDMLLKKGYRSNRDLLCLIERGGGHNEASWARRLRLELNFLLGHAVRERIPTTANISD
jgi:predicted alpha/beta superfamily hydrolase